MSEGPLAGLLSRAVVIINETGEVIYTEQVPEISKESYYAAALSAFQSYFDRRLFQNYIDLKD